MQTNKQTDKNTRGARKISRTILAAAAIVAVLAVSALAAAVLHGDFFNSAYGTGVSGQEAETVTWTDEAGNIKTETYPAVERVDVDEEQAEELIGGYVSAVGQSVTLNGYTFTISDCALDENGIGAVTLDVENPDGLNIKDGYDALNGEFPPFNIVFRYEESLEGFFDDRLYRDAELTTETGTRYVCYLVADSGRQEDITVLLSVWNGIFDEKMAAEIDNGQVFPNYDEITLTIPAAERIPVKEFSADGLTAALSPVGITLDFEAAHEEAVSWEMMEDEFVIRYADGSEYVVESDSENVINISVALHRHDGIIGCAFNRLVDVDNVTEVCISGQWYSTPIPNGPVAAVEQEGTASAGPEDAGETTVQEFSYVLTPAK